MFVEEEPLSEWMKMLTLMPGVQTHKEVSVWNHEIKECQVCP